MKKRLLALVLTLLTALAVFPLTASAAPAKTFEELLASAEKTLTLDVNTTIASDAVIPAGLTVVVPKNLKLHIASEVTVRGYILVYGTITCDFKTGKILYPDHVIIMNAGGLPSPLATYSCPFCGDLHDAGTSCPFMNGSYYCPFCKNVHAAGFVCNAYGKYHGYASYYCQFCDKYHPEGYECPKNANGSFTYCETCKAYHISGAVCGPLASPTKYYYDKTCGHFHPEGAEVTHATETWCPWCCNYHPAGTVCPTGASLPYYDFVYCALCGAFHVAGQHVYPYCETCGTYHPSGKHTLSWCPICKAYHANGQHTLIFCAVCGEYYAPGTAHTHTTPLKPFVPYQGLVPYTVSGKTAVVPQVFDTPNISYDQVATALRALNLKTTKTDISYDGVRNLKNQDLYYIVYSALLESGKINAVADDAAILSRFVNRNRIANIGAYKSALAFFAYAGQITDWSMNPRAAVPSGVAGGLINFAAALCK